MMASGWIAQNIVEIFGAVTGIAYVILEIKRNIWLWPLGIVTSAVYMYVFASNGFYANMGLQGYYLVISVYGWYVWRGTIASDDAVARSGIKASENAVARSGARASENAVARSGAIASENAVARRASSIVEPGSPPSSLSPENPGNIQGPAVNETATDVRRIDRATAVWCTLAAAAIWAALWFILDRATDSPMPIWDGLIASLSVVATWMLTRKYLEQWYVWIVANAIAVAVYLASDLYPTAVLFFVYFVMAIIGLIKWGQEARAN